MSRVQVDIIEAMDALEALAPDWWDLWRRVPAALPFLCPAWLIPWWRHFAPGRLFVMAARSNGRLVGLAPFYIESGSLGRRLLPLGISLSDHLDILLDPASSGAAWAALADSAVGRGGWDSWELENLPPEAMALRLPTPDGCKELVERQDSCPTLEFPDGAKTVRAVLPHKKRRNLNLAANRCARRGTVNISLMTGSVVAPGLDQLFRLHSERWRSRGEEGVLASPEVQAFQREAAPLMDAAGLLRLHLLTISERVAAGSYAIVHKERCFIYLTGLDPEFAFESPGALLLAHVIEQAIAEGCREIDFLRGQEAYKYGWGAVDRWNVKRSIRRTHHG